MLKALQKTSKVSYSINYYNFARNQHDLIAFNKNLYQKGNSFFLLIIDYSLEIKVGYFKLNQKFHADHLLLVKGPIWNGVIFEI